MGQKKGYKQSKEHIERRKRFGKEHHSWKGESVSEKGGRTRALRLFKDIGPCSICGNPKSERHHIDGNTANNYSSNIEITCRKCHMAIDNRLSKFVKMAKETKGIYGRMVALEKKHQQTHCKRGHKYTGLVNARGAKICRPCMKINKSNYRQRLKNMSIIESQTQT